MNIQLIALKVFSQELSTLPPLEENEEYVSYLESLFTNIHSSWRSSRLHHRSNLCAEKVNTTLHEINI